MAERNAVLLVEDDQVLMDLNKRVLEGEGYRVLPARSLKEARQTAGKDGPQTVVLDVELPDGSGLHVKAGPAGVITTDDGAASVLAAFNRGTITGCSATGVASVAGNAQAAGLVGYNTGDITNSYATGNASGGTNNGGLAGWNNSDATVTDSYWNKESMEAGGLWPRRQHHHGLRGAYHQADDGRQRSPAHDRPRLYQRCPGLGTPSRIRQRSGTTRSLRCSPTAPTGPCGKPPCAA